MFDSLMKNVKENGLGTVLIVGALVKFGYVGHGPNTPKWVMPKPPEAPKP